MASDLLEQVGLVISPLSQSATSKLQGFVPSFVTAQNPLDVAGLSFEDEAEIAETAIATFAAEEGFDKVLAVVPGLPHVDRCVQAVQNVSAQSEKAVVTVFCGGPYTDAGIERAATASLAWSDDLERTARALAAATRFAEIRDDPPPGTPERRPAMSGGAVTLTEYEAKRRLAPYGLIAPDERLCTTLDEVVEAARSIGFPVALKVQSRALPHKSDIGGVALGLQSEEMLRRAFAEMRQRVMQVASGETVASYLVQEMLPDGVEVFVGVKNDPTYGPALLLGPGGILVEVMHDVAVMLLPGRREDIERLIGHTALHRLMAGVRGKAPSNRQALIDAVEAIARFAVDHAGTVSEIDINPLIVDARRAVAADALIVEHAG